MKQTFLTPESNSLEQRLWDASEVSAVAAAKCVDYVFQGAGSEEAHLSEDRGLWPLWPRVLPMGAAQKAQILNVLSFSPQACWCILQRSLQSSGEKCPSLLSHYTVSYMNPSSLLLLVLFTGSCVLPVLHVKPFCIILTSHCPGLESPFL